MTALQQGGTPESFKLLGEPLAIESIEFRVQSINKDGWAIILPYKNARVDMDRLDAAIGRGFWERRHERIDGREYCHVSIWNVALGRFITVSDVGVPSNTEAVKGEASDAFKRACFNLGIGRELYEFPLILLQLKADEFRISTEGKDKGKVKQTFALHLRDWIWHIQRSAPDEHGKTFIEALQAVDDHGAIRFSYPRGKAPAKTDKAPASVPRETSAGAATHGSGQAPKGEKEWYNDFDANKDWMKTQFANKVTAAAMIAKLEEKYRLSRETKTKIQDLAVATSTAGQTPDDDIPF